MQTIPGASGIIGHELARNLTSYTSQVRLVSRRPRHVLGHEELAAADLLKADETDTAVAGSELVYLTAGLPYHYKVWQQQCRC